MRATLWGIAIGVIAACLCALPAVEGAQQTAPAAKAASAKAEVVGYRIAGVVVDAATGTPVPGAELFITEAAAELQVTSDEQGRFVFAGLEPGKYAVTATAPGFVREAFNEHRGYSTAMAVGPGLDSEHMSFRLHRQAVVTGTVTDELGEPVRKAQVWLFVEDRLTGKTAVRMTWQTQTDDLGTYRFPHLQAGKYFVAVSARPWYAQSQLLQQQTALNLQAQGSEGDGGSQPMVGRSLPELAALKTDRELDVVYPTTFYPGVSDEHEAGEVVLATGQTEQADVRLQAVPAAHLLLTNLPKRDKDNPGVGIGAMEKMFGAFSTGLPVVVGEVAPGVYEVAGVPPGRVSLNVSENRGGEWQNRTIHADARDGDSIDAGAAGLGGTVSGKVILAEGNATGVQGNVFLTSPESQTTSRNLQKDGSFSMAGVEAGTYEVQVNLQPGAPDDYVESVTGTGAKVDGQSVKVESTGDAQLVIRMGRGLGQIKGVVKGDGKPEAGVMVLLVPAEPGSREYVERRARMDQSDSDGTFTLGRVLPGKYVLMAIEDGWELDWENEEVLRPYKEKGQSIEVGAHEVKSVEVGAEKRVGSQ